MSEPFIGQIMMVGFNFAPRGWAQCDGQLLPIAQNTALYSLLSTTYGGDGVNTFALPDLRGRVPVHMGTGPGLTPRQQGQRGGQETVVLSAAQMPSHTHSLQAQNDAASVGTPGGHYLAQQDRPNIYDSDSDKLVSLGQEAIEATGGSQPHDNMQPYLVLNFVIALDGIYPERS